MADLTKEQVLELAHRLMFDLSGEEADQAVKEFTELERYLTLLRRIDTEGVEPMVLPFDRRTAFLREDEPEKTLTQEDALSNVRHKEDGYAVLPRVVK